MGDVSDSETVAGIRDLLERARARLEAARARDEALAELVPERRVMLIRREPVMVPVTRVWRLGVLLLARDGSLFATGALTRALEPGRTQYQSQSAEDRRAYRAAAFRGKFEKGETVNFDASPIELHAEALRMTAGPLFLDGDRPRVRWNATLGDASAIDLDTYLDDRVDLLAHPPQGA